MLTYLSRIVLKQDRKQGIQQETSSAGVRSPRKPFSKSNTCIYLYIYLYIYNLSLFIIISLSLIYLCYTCSHFATHLDSATSQNASIN